MFIPTGRLPRKDICKAQECYAAIKRDIEAEYHSGENPGRVPPLTDAERTLYHPAIRKAFSNLAVPTNAVPEGWVPSLFQTSLDLAHVIGTLRAKDRERN
jgi:hypothetical protein